MPSAIVFDLDDTLYPEREYVDGGLRAVARWAEERLRVPSGRCFEELHALFDQGVRGRAFDDWLEGRVPDPERLVPEMVAVYRAHEPEIRPYPGVERLLERLLVAHRLAVLTDGPSAVQRRKFARLGLERFFDEVMFTDDLGRASWKPSSRPFRVLLARLGLVGSGAVYVADNPTKDFIGARRAGMSTVRVRFAGGLYAELRPPTPAHEADTEVCTLDDLGDVLGRMTPAARTAGAPEP